jgi:hypothetical protein
MQLLLQKPGSHKVKNTYITSKSIFVIVFLVVYVIAYLAISRTSEARARAVGAPGFYYAPVSVDTIATSRKAQWIHHVGIYVFYPIWLVDNCVFGGPEYAAIPDTGGFQQAE